MGLRRLTRRLTIVAVAGVIVVGGLDAGSVALTCLQLPDNVKAAGYAAAEVSVAGPTTRSTAVDAWRTAEQSAEHDGFTVRPRSFTIYPGGRVQLTGTREAPTLLLCRLHVLQHLAWVTSTQTVTALPS